MKDLRIIPDDQLPGIPILGLVSAGAPRFFDEVELGYVTVPLAGSLHANSDIFALRVSGDSMIDDGIYDGNFLIVKSTYDFSNGDIVIAYVNDEATVKRIYKQGSKVILMPANAELQPLEVDLRVSEFRVGGKVVDVIRN